MQVRAQQDTDITAGFWVREGYPAARTALQNGWRLIYDAKLLERRVACQKLKQFREPWKCIGTQVHFEVGSDLPLEREIRPIIHLKKHLNIFTFCKEKGKVYSSGVYVCSKIFFAIWHSLLHLFIFDERDGKKSVEQGNNDRHFHLVGSGWMGGEGGGEWAEKSLNL